MLKTGKKILCTLLVVIVCLNVIPLSISAEESYSVQFQGGDGTKENPYQVSTPEQLNAVRNDLDAHYIQMNDIDMSSWGNWKPIGLEDVSLNLESTESPKSTRKAFTGSFNGQNYAIKNLKIKDTSISFTDDCFGLFASINNSVLENINLVDIDYMIDKSTTDYVELCKKYGSRYSVIVGGIVGESNNSVIDKCSVTGSIYVEHCSDAYIGGVVGNGGLLLGYVGEGSDISECINKAKINVNADRSSFGIQDSTVMCGGLIGCTGTMSRNANYGDIKVYAGQFAYVGGISGQNANIENCFNYANMSGYVIHGGACSTLAANCNVGGIIGTTTNHVQYCVNYGNIYAYSVYAKSWWGCETGSSAGGIVGFYRSYGWPQMVNCVNISDEIFSYTTEENGSKIVDVAGRIAGAAHSVYINECRSYDKTKVNNDFVAGTISDINGASCSAEQLLSESTYVGFDFENTWKIDPIVGGAVLKSHNENKPIAILTTNKSFCIEPKDSMWVAFGIMREDGLLEENWRKMAVTVSDPTIVSLSEYEERIYGYSLEIKGKKEGSTNIVVTDTESGSSEVFKVTVCDDFSKSASFSIENVRAFYPSTKHDEKVLTNIYNMNGLYVNNYKCVKTSKGYDVTFDVYNERYHIGAVDVFDKNGNWIESVEIKKYTDITSLYDTGEDVFYMIKDAFDKKWMTYEMECLSKHTAVKISVPEGGYFTVSNNFAESIGTFFFNSAEIFYEGVSAAIDLIAGNVDSEPFFDLLFGKLNETPSLKKAFQDIFTSSLDKEIRDISQNILKGNAENAYITIAGLFKNILEAYNIEWQHLVQILSGVSQSVFEKFAGPFGLALQSCFALTGYTNKLLNARHIATSINKPYASFYSDTENGFVNPYGVYVTDNGNIDAEAVLQVFRISNDDSISVLLDSSDPLSIHELYNICFIKNDKLVQPNGKVKVHIPIPDNMKGNTCTVYRQETDGSWTILQACKEGGYLVFETDHFSLYAIIGIKNELEINTLPNKLTYELNERLDMSGLTLKMNDNLISSGYIYTPSILLPEYGKQTITVSYMGLDVTFDVSVEPHQHTVNGDGICEKCGVDVTENCSCRCHKTGFIAKLIWKIMILFNKLLRRNQVCSCGIYHY